jgi:predicted membrane protein
MASIYCPKCGAKSEYGKYCRVCGTNLAAVSEVIDERQASQLATPQRGGTTLGIFGSALVTNDHRDLADHKTTSIFGNVKIDLTGAPLPAGEITVSAYSIFGSVKVFVPEDVGIRITGISAFAEVKVRGVKVHNGFFDVNEYRSPNYEQTTRRVHFEIATFFSNMKVRR